MRRRLTGILIVVLTCAAVAVWGQQGQPRPGPGSGIVTVAGTVNLGNSPAVKQEGDWKVSIANAPSVKVENTPSVSLAPLPFIKAGQRYQVIWSAGDTEQIAVAAAGTGAWVRVSGPERWVN